MKLYSIACTDSVETAFQEMQVQEPRGLTCINAGSAGAPLWSSRSHLQGLALFGKGASMFKPQVLCAALIAATVTGCDKPVPPAPQARPVRAAARERFDLRNPRSRNPGG